MIDLWNIQKSFGELQVLKGIDLKVQKGEVVTLLGPSGSGKTTLLRCINFLERPNMGTVTVDDVKVDCALTPRKPQVLALRRKTAMVFQSYNLFKNKTAIENIMEGLVIVQKRPVKEAREKSLHLLEKVGLADRAAYYPSQLSGGQQQRVGIARALALNPTAILFDEPTSALDPELVGEVLGVMKDIASEGITMLVVTHEMTFAREVADRVIFMADGTVVEQAKPKDFFDKPQHPRTIQFLQRLAGKGA